MRKSLLQIGMAAACMIATGGHLAFADGGAPEPNGFHAGGFVIHPGATLDIAADVNDGVMRDSVDGLIDIGAYVKTHLEDESMYAWNNEVKFQWRQFWGVGDSNPDGGANVHILSTADLFKTRFFRVAPTVSYTFVDEPEDEYLRQDYRNHSINAGAAFYIQPGAGAIFSERLSYNFHAHIYQEHDDISYLKHRVESVTRWNFLPNTSMSLNIDFTPVTYLEEERQNSDINDPSTSENSNSFPLRIRYSLQGLILPRLSYRLGAGYAYVYYTNDNKEHMFIMNAKLQYEFSENVSLSVEYRKDFDNAIYGDYVKFHRVSALFNGFWFNHLETKAEVGYGNFDYRSVSADSRMDHLISADASVAYYIFPGLSVGAEYRLRYNLSDLDLARYTRHLITLKAAYEF